MKAILTTLGLATLLAVSTLPASAATAAARKVPVQFAKGASSAVLNGSVKGDAMVDYTLGARAGQTLTVSMKAGKSSVFFNINPPGTEVAMFAGERLGNDAKVMLPADGTYVVRVFVNRADARRGGGSSFKLDVGISGDALPALPFAQDAPVAGTRFHATADVPCQLLGVPPGGQCKAGVVRRGRDGTATVQLRSPNGVLRQLLFVKGNVVAADSSDEVKTTRQGDVNKVEIGDGYEKYDVPDPLLNGG